MPARRRGLQDGAEVSIAQPRIPKGADGGKAGGALALLDNFGFFLGALLLSVFGVLLDKARRRCKSVALQKICKEGVGAPAGI